MKNYAFWSGILGNIMDHYDVAIYAFLAPHLATIFFPKNDSVVAIILAYGLMSLGIFTRPLGAYIFGQMAMNRGAKQALIIILIGMSLSTITMGLMPTYNTVGSAAPVLLAIVRAVQSIFAAGEVSVAAMFILEHEKDGTLGKTSSYYSCSTMIGIGLASLVATFVSSNNLGKNCWRYAFLASLLTIIPALFMRTFIKDLKGTIKKHNGLKVISVNKHKLLQVIFTSSFSYMTYAVPFVFMNSFIPHILPITNTEMLAHSNILTIFDIVLILLFGSVVDKFRHYKWMAFISGLLAITIIPIFYFLPSCSLIGVTIIRMWIIILGVAYSDPLNAWFFKLVGSNEKYIITGVGYAIGTELLGRNTTVICWSLFYYFGSVVAPAFFIGLVSLIACSALLVHRKDKTELRAD